VRKLFEKTILTVHPLLSGRNILPHLRRAQENEWLSSQDLVALQTRRLRQLLLHASQNVPFYRQRFLQTGLTPDDIQDSSDLAQLPALTKDELRANIDSLIADNYHRSDLIARSTGGSTGVPTKFYYDRAFHADGRHLPRTIEVEYPAAKNFFDKGTLCREEHLRRDDDCGGGDG